MRIRGVIRCIYEWGVGRWELSIFPYGVCVELSSGRYRRCRIVGMVCELDRVSCR